MRYFGRAATAAALVLSSGAIVGTAVAADFPEPLPVIEAPEPLPITGVGGWYLRGDIGYKVYNDPDAKLSNPDYAGGSFTGGLNELTDTNLDDAYNIGVGVGYKVNDYLRADLTLDYETPAEFGGRLFCPGAASCPDADGDGTPDAFSEESADITAWSALANVYADLGTFYGITPYVGAGAGLSYLVTDDVKSSIGAEYDGDERFNFAWALMAGASYALTDQLALDVGYRYLNLGDAESGVIASGTGETTRIRYENIDAHEVRVGLRYNLY